MSKVLYKINKTYHNVLLFVGWHLVIFLLLWQLPSADGVSEPQEENVFEHLDGGEHGVELGAVNLLPPDRHLAQGEPHHLSHLRRIKT